jgi:hypothetical protein
MHGSCVCGAVEFEVDGPIRDGIACHCSQCRKMSGHFWVASSVPLDRFRLTRDDGLEWYAASDQAARGFCKRCGSFLLWKPAGEDRMSFALGAIDGPTGVEIASHIFTGDAGDYYAPEGPPPEPAPAPERLHASCHCGGVSFSFAHGLHGMGACHCSQCRKHSGHFAVSLDADETSVTYGARETLAEFTTQGGAQRGFCTRCGSSLYFRADEGFSVEAGAIDGPTGVRLESHIFVLDKGDYYALDDGLPQFTRWD